MMASAHVEALTVVFLTVSDIIYRVQNCYIGQVDCLVYNGIFGDYCFRTYVSSFIDNRIVHQ